jgi:hypothetical protein
MTGDVEAARKLLREKSELRKAELDAADRHFERLREGRPESLETTSLHLDALADLKRIHSHICSVAYPVLEAAGRPFGVKRFQTIHHYSVDVARGLVLLFGIGTRDLVRGFFSQEV